MIIWINGAFGSGKTTIAEYLKSTIPNSFLFDPEETGFYIRENLPDKIKTPDFQDYPMWRQFNFEMLSYISSNFDGIIIVPMTLTNPEYFKEIINLLRIKNIELFHFTLLAKRETLLMRLDERDENVKAWATEQIPRCINAFNNSIFKNFIETDSKDVEMVANEIVNSCNLTEVLYSK